MAGSMQLGGGGRFAKLASSLSHRPGVKDPKALAAAIGRKKYGASKMAKLSASGRKSSMAEHLASLKKSGHFPKDKD